MARCPFAEWKAISGPSGAFTSGPFKIVHHTTEGRTASDAFKAYAANKSDPHFTVDTQKIYQHIDTSEAARSLRNAADGVQTNRDSALQIELVGFAGARKNAHALHNLARLCRWLEGQHQVALTWPSGKPKPPLRGGDPGGHNRDAWTWDNRSGHYGHCHVPENTHWDPAFDAMEADFVLGAVFDRAGLLINAQDPKVRALINRPNLGLDAPQPQVIYDHAVVGEETP